MTQEAIAEDIQDTLPTLDYIDRPAPLAKIIELRNKKLTYTEIGQIVGCSKQRIHQRLKPFLSSIDSLDSIKANRADTLTVLTNGMVEAYLNLTEDEQKELIKRRGMVDYGILYDKERLERGESTHNIASIHTDIQAMKAMKQANKHKIQGEADGDG